MTRIFLSLAWISLALLGANIVIGLNIGDFNGEFAAVRDGSRPLLDRKALLRDRRPRPVAEIEALNAQLDALHARLLPLERRATVHILFGVAAALVSVLVNSICVTYFVGTSRWIREVVDTYGFPQEWIAEGDRIKRRTFPWAVTGMLLAVGIIALGAAAHPGTIRAGTALWVTPHMTGAILGTALIGLAYFRQSHNIAENYALIQRIVAQVQLTRRAKGLDNDAAPPAPLKPEFVE